MENLARRDKTPEVIEEITAKCEDELTAAGIPIYTMKFLAEQGEVPSASRGQLSMWGFKRAWYYWVATGPGLPPAVADALHEAHGRVVRVDGHCGCPSPREWFKGFGVGCYHVDTQEGLNALAAAIKSVYDSTLDPTAQPRHK